MWVYATNILYTTLGAHTLGEANKDNSGYDKAWVDNEYGLDNAYYTDMIERDWEQVGYLNKIPRLILLNFWL